MTENKFTPVCPYCNKVYSGHRDNLPELHLSQRPLTCTKCNKEFWTRVELIPVYFSRKEW